MSFSFFLTNVLSLPHFCLLPMFLILSLVVFLDYTWTLWKDRLLCILPMVYDFTQLLSCHNCYVVPRTVFTSVFCVLAARRPVPRTGGTEINTLAPQCWCKPTGGSSTPVMRRQSSDSANWRTPSASTDATPSWTAPELVPRLVLGQHFFSYFWLVNLNNLLWSVYSWLLA